jgi:tRNA uridine 5-carbamoylmethylation protein Kti12
LVNQVIFSIAEEGIIACIMADYSHQLDQRRELMAIKDETIKNVNEVVDNQMKVVQEIAGLLGETTAQTKVSLLKIIQMLQHEAVESVSGLAVEAEEDDRRRLRPSPTPHPTHLLPSPSLPPHLPILP